MEERDTDPRVEAFYETIPKWVVDNKTYKNYLHNTKQLERLKDFKWRQRLYLKELNKKEPEFYETLRQLGFSLQNKEKGGNRDV